MNKGFQVIYDGEEMEVSQEVGQLLDELRREKEAEARRDRRNLSDKECCENYIEGFMFQKPEEFVDELIKYLEIEALREAVNSLSDKQRRRLIAYYYDERTYQEIAASEGVSHKNIIKSVKAAIEKLRKKLNP